MTCKSCGQPLFKHEVTLTECAPCLRRAMTRFVHLITRGVPWGHQGLPIVDVTRAPGWIAGRD